jgi:ABC-2 type transport system ATP-binding protein
MDNGKSLSNMIINVENLSKEYKVIVKSNFWRDLLRPQYKKVIAVNDISFSIDKGESVALLGPNGAGKTTTMKMLSGLIYPTQGKVKVLNHFPFDRKKEFLMRIGLVMGNKAGLDWDLTPSQSFELIKQIYKISDKDFSNRLNILTNLLEVEKFKNTQVRKLSLGERMKMELISAILHNPDVLFLDEPTIGLDIISKQKIRNFLRDIQSKYGITLLLTSHDMDDVEKVCDRVMVINQGVKVYDNSLNNLMKEHTKDRYIKFIFNDKPRKSEIFHYGEIINTTDNSYTFKVNNEDLPNVIAKVTANYKLADIDILSVPLEEIITDIYHQ